MTGKRRWTPAEQRAYRKANPDKARRWDRKSQLKKLYGLTPEQVEEKYQDQCGKCALCDKSISPQGRDTHVDHNHETGQFRGLLCQRCNVEIAPFENAEFRNAAEAYLRRTEMVAKKAKSEPTTETQAWGAKTAPAEPKPSDPLDPGEIPAFLRREAEPRKTAGEQTDIEDFVPAAGDVPAHDPETGELTETDVPEPATEPESTQDLSQAPADVTDEELAAATPTIGGDGRTVPPTDNQPKTATVIDTETAQTVAGQQLYAFVERVERLEEEKKAIADDIKEVFAEMKGNGFDTTAVRTLIRLRKMDQATRQERESILEIYMAAIGMS